MELAATLVGHTRPIAGIAWSPDGRQLATAGRDHTVRVWDVERCVQLQSFSAPGEELAVAWHPRFRMLASAGKHEGIRLRTIAQDTAALEHTRILRHHAETVRCLAWSHDGQKLGSCCDNGRAAIWTDDGPVLELIGHDNWVRSIAWAPGDRRVVTGGDDRTVRVWDARTGAAVLALTGHSSWVHRVIWSPDGALLVSTSEDMTVRVWDAVTGQTRFIVEAHTAPVAGVAFSPEGRLLATKSEDGTVRLWNATDWTAIATIDEPPAADASLYASVAFHPFGTLLATLGDQDRAVRLWRVGKPSEPARTAAPPERYRNAKVVVVGDSGVGKSGLAHVLGGDRYRPTESTHGCKVWTIDRSTGGPETESRELVLWDLAGQAGYRVVHQLHLDQVVVALLVFDARSDADPIAGVRYWNRALEQARRLQGDGAPPLVKLLVLARADRGRLARSPAELAAVLAELGCAGYVETSAKEGWGIAELSQRIEAAIAWDALPNTVSSALFRDIKAFLLERKRAGRSLASCEELVAGLGRDGVSRPELDACIAALEARGMIRRLSFGDLVLLQPELSDAYAAAILLAARDDVRGLGCLSEDDVRAGRFRMPDDERITDRKREEVLLIATIEDLLRHEIALREQSEVGAQLVFPSQATAPLTDGPTVPAAIVLAFEGPIDSIYATLLVRLSHSGRFHRTTSWRAGCAFRADAGGDCGLRLLHAGEGAATLELWFGAATTAQTRRDFERYVQAHVERGAIRESVVRRVRFACACGEPVPPASVETRLSRGKTTIACAACDEPVLLVDPAGSGPIDLDAMNRAADAHRRDDVAVSTLQGKRTTRHFDVFLCHNHADKPAVRALARRLEAAGLLPWLDEEQLQPGVPWQKELERMLPEIHGAAVLLGTQLGPWQEREAEMLIDELGRRKLPIVPVILPAIAAPAELPLFMRAMTIVDMRAELPDPIDQLVWGITGKRRH